MRQVYTESQRRKFVAVYEKSSLSVKDYCHKPPVLLKRRYIRRKYAVKNPVEDAKGNIVIADLTSRPLPKAIAEASLVGN